MQSDMAYRIRAGDIPDGVVRVLVLHGGHLAGESVRHGCAQGHKTDCRHRILQPDPAALFLMGFFLRIHGWERGGEDTHKLRGQIADEGRECADL